MEFQTRATWTNVAGNQRSEPFRTHRPVTVAVVPAVVHLDIFGHEAKGSA